MQSLLLLVCAAIAQSPQSIPYQAVARDSFGTPLPNQHIQLRMSIRTGSAGGTIVYQETDTATTSKLGMFTVNVGSGSVVSGTFSAIDWANGSKYLQVEIDPAGGTSYVNMGASQLLSVPYALYAKSSSLTNIPSKRIPYGTNTGLTSDVNFTRDSLGGNTLIKAAKNGSYYLLSVGDSTYLDVVGGGNYMNIPSAALSYGDSAGDFSMNIGVGKVPGYGLTQFGFLNLSKSDGTFAGLNFLEYDGRPMLIAGASKTGLTGSGGSNLHLDLESASITYSTDGSSNGHGIIADSTSLRIYSSTTGTDSWTWPNTDGTNGQALTTNGSGTLTWATPTGYTIQFASADFNPADGATYYFGTRSFLQPNNGSEGGRVLRIPKAGTLKVANLYAYVDGTFGSSENVSFYIRKNSTTDYAISTTTTLNGFRSDAANTSLSISLSVGDEIEIKMVSPTWATNPTNVGFSGMLYIE